tara:strand:- start:94 stop:378 length:285 start_codon:yes stop_codon:yes gene_type:complete
MSSTKVEIYIKEIDKVVILDVEYAIENTGLGAYECWGSKFFDEGNEEIILLDIELLKDGLSDGEYYLAFDIIDDLDSDDGLYDDIVQIIDEKID